MLLTWLWLTAYVYLFGAELNSELERQTARDTTTGADKPMGRRGAVAADTVAGDPKPKGPGVASTAIGLRAATRVTGRKAGLAPTLLTAIGLSRLGRGGGAGAALIAAGAALAWLGRDKPEPSPRSKAAPATRP